MPVLEANSGQACSVALDFPPGLSFELLFKDIQKYSVLLEDTPKPTVTTSFEAKMRLWDARDEVEVKAGYEPVVFSKTFRQSCKIESNFFLKPGKNKLYKSKSKGKMNQSNSAEVFAPRKRRCDSEFLVSLQNEKVPKDGLMVYSLKGGMIYDFLFTFKFRPQYVLPGSTVVISDNKVRAIGTITSTLNS